MTTEQAAAQVGMSPEWVRKQIRAQRLRATVLRIGAGRPTYRIAVEDWRVFRRRYVKDTRVDDWE